MDRPTDQQIEDALNDAAGHLNEGTSQWPGMTYEAGVAAALAWVLDVDNDHPMTDE